MCRKPIPVILFTLVLVGLSNSAFKIQPIEVAVSSGYEASLAKAALFLNSTQFDSAVGLCREAPKVDPDAFWLVSDNLLAYHALEYYYPETAAVVYATMLHYGYFRSYKHEVLFGTTIPYIPFETNNTYLVAQNGTKLIETEVFNGSSPVSNYTEYADLCIYAALHFYWCGNIPQAVAHFDIAKKLWNETLHGVYDNASKDAENRSERLIFSTYKLSLLLFCSRILGQPLENETSIEETLWLMQGGENGGLHTDYDISLNYTGSDVNTETTSLAILAYKYEPKIVNRPVQLPPSLNIPPDYQKIQEAVNAASPGDIIHVYGPDYYEENVIVDKSVSLIGIFGPGLVSFNVVADNVYIKGFCFSSPWGFPYGRTIVLNGVSGCEISNVIVSNIDESSGIVLTDASNNVIANSRVWGLPWGGGIVFERSSNNTIFGNTIEANYGPSIYLADSSDNKFFHNQFYVYEARQVEVIGRNKNVWDDGYPSGGNYWSDYNDTDLHSGSYQNQTGSDGIGDTGYVIYGNNTDHYPLMGMFSSFNTSLGYGVDVVSNSTIEDFTYFESNSTVTLHVFNMTVNQTNGFCRLTIPHGLLSPPYTITINGTQVSYTPIFENETLSVIYFSYEHSELEIVIIPEFPSFIILPLFMIATLLAVLIYRRKHTLDNSAVHLSEMSNPSM
jgi:parallel beta-helix repeat protein